jgi:hypothetical protein
MAQSNFKAIFENRNKPQGATIPSKKASKRKKPDVGIQAPETKPEPPPKPPEMKEQKPLAKSKDPGFIQGNFYIRQTTHAQVKIKLLQQGKGKDLSELVEELLTSWLAK